MAIISGPEEAPIPINVGLLFFNEHPEAFFPATQIDVVWFPDGPGADKFEEKIFRGPLGRIVRESIEYIRRNFISETVIKHPGRAEATRIVNFPFEAIEEAVVNAVYHRSYEIREPIEIRISPQEFVVLSFPGPDRSIRLDDLQEGRAVSRRYRNRRIGEFLKELDLTEGRATGIPKILRAMRDNGSPAPQFETDDDRSFFLIRLPVHPSAKVTPEVTHQVTHQVTPQVTPQVEVLLRAFEHDHSREELQAKLGLADRHNFRTLYLLPALNDGLVEMAIPGKPNSRLQKYRLTAKGRAFLTARKGGDSGG
jgi:ATP-dependent DNA helicase RecG